MNKFDDLAQVILKNIGGSSNIRSLTHCVTRLRFRLKDESRVNSAALNHTDGIVTVIRSGGQYMLVIGSHVTDVYNAVCSAAGIRPEAACAAASTAGKDGFFHHLIQKLSGHRSVAMQNGAAAGLVIGAPVKGKVHALQSIEDPVFASGVLGKGCAIEPSQGLIVAPFSGTVRKIAQTKHAISLVSEQGVEVLIHVGMNTIELHGTGFTPLVHPGDAVQKGQPLLRFDRETIAASGCSLMTPVIVTDPAGFRTVEPLVTGNVAAGQDLLLLQ